MTVELSINSVWRQAISLPFPERGNQVTCSIPDELIDNVREMARNNSDIPIIIWVDIYGLGKNSNHLMRDLNDQEITSNITFKSLDNIPAYSKHPLYKLPFNGFKIHMANIWEQLDLARMHVIDHVLTTGHESAIYTDMDINFNDPSFKQAIAILEKTGTVAALTEINRGVGLENSFFGFSQTSHSFLKEKLIKPGEYFSDDSEDQYSIFIHAFDPENAAPYGVNREKSGVLMKEIDGAHRIKSSYQYYGLQ